MNVHETIRAADNTLPGEAAAEGAVDPRWQAIIAVGHFVETEGTYAVRVWLVTDHIGDQDASSRVVYDAARKKFGLVMELQNGVLWYMGPYGSLVNTVQSI